MMLNNNQVILSLDDYNAMRDELRVLKEGIANAVSVETSYGSEESGRIAINVAANSYLRHVIDIKAAEAFKGPIAFQEKLIISSWSEKNLLFIESKEGKEEIESIEEDL